MKHFLHEAHRSLLVLRNTKQHFSTYAWGPFSRAKFQTKPTKKDCEEDTGFHYKSGIKVAERCLRPRLETCVRGNPNFSPLCVCLHIPTEALQVLIFGLQINFRKSLNSQIRNPWIIRVEHRNSTSYSIADQASSPFLLNTDTASIKVLSHAKQWEIILC